MSSTAITTAILFTNKYLRARISNRNGNSSKIKVNSLCTFVLQAPQSTLNTHFHIPQERYARQVIHSIWQVEGFTSFQNEIIIPKGVVEIIFNFKNPVAAQINGKSYYLPGCFINGFNTVPVQLRLPEFQHFFGVRLQPLAIKKIFGTPGAEFLDVAIDLTLIDKSINTLWHQLAEESDFNKRTKIFIKWITRRTFDWHPQEQLMNNFLCAINLHDLTATTLANTICYSPRHLSRKILETTGMNTEEILHYKKYLHALHLMHQSNLSLTAITYQSHFADQSHFIRSFRQYSGMTPGAFRRNHSHQKGHIYENVR